MASFFNVVLLAIVGLVYAGSNGYLAGATFLWLYFFVYRCNTDVEWHKHQLERLYHALKR